MDELWQTVSDACRVLAAHGVVDGILGHVSARVDPGHLLVRTRGPRERGLRYTEPADVRLVDLDGRGDDLGEWRVPNELPIHTEVLRTRPEVGAVVHAHPPALLVCGLAGLPLRPVYGAFDIPGMRLAVGGVPVYPRSVLIRRRELAEEMLAAMGDRPVCLLRGHGVTVTGASVEEAVVRTIALETLARVTLELNRLGADVPPVSDADLAELPDLGPAFTTGAQWRALLASVKIH
ncbi:class II aldolase/adducin family protein [Amycolatopsis sacchari]|uniref:Ribulose-5-phosphate 4-epimerase/Fuculose-1-phosphate aldolase n=1 Tax=Amycolatopsis sacchari TaxID=115433 RepID=A0A1I4CTY6_9PSEU|nr:class II aldolase/adducin family protein [Amycolatopsis sacchari]SFK83697.1 Ribulose-5-phosphate 4-epimerase/Fuculose-1-phosphate aldolase [Amycolatopsis sacchari]